jgi:hypothetical protein
MHRSNAGLISGTSRPPGNLAWSCTSLLERIASLNKVPEADIASAIAGNPRKILMISVITAQRPLAKNHVSGVTAVRPKHTCAAGFK